VDVPVKGDLAAPVSFSAGTQLTPSEADGLVFETTMAVTLSRSRLQKVFVDDGTESIDQTIANGKGRRGLPGHLWSAPWVGAHLSLCGFGPVPYPESESTLRPLTVNVFTDDPSAENLRTSDADSRRRRACAPVSQSCWRGSTWALARSPGLST
jgi:hypothetical protein